MRPFVIAVVVWMSVAAHAQTPLPAEYCPAGASPPSCGFLPSDENVRRAEVGASKLRYLLLAWYTKCVSKAVLQKSQAGRASFDQCALDAMARGINRFNALESQPSCENFSLIARNLLIMSKWMAGRLYCNGTVPFTFGVPGRFPADAAVARVARGASKLLVREYKGMVKCFGNGVEARAKGQGGTLARCVAKLRAVQERRMLGLDFSLPGFGSLGCLDPKTGTDVRRMLTQIDASANLNPQIFCSM